MIYLQLFISFFKVGLFSFGGGYAALPLIQDQIVTNNGWISMEEFTHLITISQMTPGPIAINAATFVGIKVAGLPGAILATVGCIAPSCIIVTILAILYLKYRNATGDGGPHWLCRGFHFDHCVLGQRCCHQLCTDELAHDCHFRALLCALTQNKIWRCADYALGRCYQTLPGAAWHRLKTVLPIWGAFFVKNG